MMNLRFSHPYLKGKLRVASDKSISHRALMLGAYSKGKTEIHHLLQAKDITSTKEALQKAGVIIREDNDRIIVEGCNHQWKEEELFFDLGNSGTSARLLAGLFANTTKTYHFIGDESLQQRPMKRIIDPLEKMGVHFTTQNMKLPFAFSSMELQGITYSLPVASAQVKSAILLAGLSTKGNTTVIETIPTRNHTEEMLPFFGGKIEVQEKEEHTEIQLVGNQELEGTELFVPADISSAAFFIVGAILTPKSDLYLMDLTKNKTRNGLVEVLLRMGAHLEWIPQKNGLYQLHCQYSPNLKGTIVEGKEIPQLIDELPLLALVATQAKGKTIVRNAEELKVKESNRILSTATELKKLGADIVVKEDGWEIAGSSLLHGGKVESHQDHRIAMMLMIAALLISEPVLLIDEQAMEISYPSFMNNLQSVLYEEFMI